MPWDTCLGCYAMASVRSGASGVTMDESSERSHLIIYPDFEGSPSECVEYFLNDFESIAQYNEEGTDEEKLGILPGLLKKRAAVWYKFLPKEEAQNWGHLRAAFVNKFRRNSHRLLTKLSRLKHKQEDSIRRYSIKVIKLINALQMIDGPYPERLKVWWYLNGLPSSIRSYCRQADSTTLEATISTAKKYESATQVPRGEVSAQVPENIEEGSLYSEFDAGSLTSQGSFSSSVPGSVESKKGRKIVVKNVYSSSSSPSRRNAARKSAEPVGPTKEVGRFMHCPVSGVKKGPGKVNKKLEEKSAVPPRQKFTNYSKKVERLTSNLVNNVQKLTVKTKEPIQPQEKRLC